MAPFKLFCSQLLCVSHCEPPLCHLSSETKSTSEKPTVYKPESPVWNTVSGWCFPLLNKQDHHFLSPTQPGLSGSWMNDTQGTNGYLLCYAVGQETGCKCGLIARICFFPARPFIFLSQDSCHHGNCPTSRMETKANFLLPALSQRGNPYTHEAKGTVGKCTRCGVRK